METKIKPCPFCGAEVQPPEDEDSLYCVEHKEWCVLYDRWRGYTTVLAEHELEAWNTRCERTCREVNKYPDGGSCSECGTKIRRTIRNGKAFANYCGYCGAKVIN